jgi:F420-dependent oxidoreductase-like protein
VLLRVFVEPQQGAAYGDLLAVARAAEDYGFDGFFRSDHYLADAKFPVARPGGLPGPSDAWATLAGLARETSRVRLGTLMTAATFRHPGPLAITVAGVDEMSGGRVELGIGTGWFAAEHLAYGLPFPGQAERFGRFTEQVEIITGLWRTPVGQHFSFGGRYYQLKDSPALPKPAQDPHPPLIIGGHGARRTPALAALHAAEFNVPYAGLATVSAQFTRVRAACEAAGRDATSIRLSAVLPLCCGRTGAEVVRRAAAQGKTVAELRDAGLAGSPAEVTDTLGRFAEAGADRIYLSILDLADLDHLALTAAEVLPAAARL